MVVIERLTQQIYPGKWKALSEIDKKYDVVEKRLGFPQNKRRMQCLIGGCDFNTLVIERQWESMAFMEATYEKAFADPEMQALQQETIPIVKSNLVEVFVLLP